MKIPVSSSYCDQLIMSHPDHPSLLSVVDTLDRLGIPNVVAKIEKEQLADLPFPYVLQLNYKKELRTITSARDLTKYKQDIEDLWSGVVLHAERPAEINDPENNRLYKRERFFSFFTYAVALALVIPFAWSAFNAQSLYTTAISLSAIAGLVVGYLLIGKDLGVKFDVVENFCTPNGKRNSCDAILESDAASLFGFLKLSDMVFIYFLSQVCCIAALAVVPSWSGTVLQAMAGLSVLAVPAVIYSIIYQWKTNFWCKLCLIVDGILLLQTALFFLPGNVFIEPVHLPAVAAVAAGALTVATMVILYKGQLEDSLELRKHAASGWRVKNSHLVFEHLASSEKGEVAFNSPIRIRSGREDTPLRLVMAGNLYCKPCGIQHEKIENLVDLYPELISVEYRFVSAKDKDKVFNSNHYVIEYWIKNIRGRDNERELTRKLLNDWYQYIEIEKFRQVYPLSNDTPSEECVELEKEHVAWCKRQSIMKTPTIFLNGKELPKEYWPADLSIMIPSLVNFVKAKAVAATQDVKDFV